MKNAFYIARMDLIHTLRDRTTVLWIAVMPALFFYVIGSATGGSATPAARENVAVKRPADAGFLADQLARRLEEAGLNVVQFDSAAPETPLSGGSPAIAWGGYCRQLSLPAGMTADIQAGRPVSVSYGSCRDELGAAFDRLRIQRAVYTTLADIIAVGAAGAGLSESSVAALNAAERSLTLEVTSAGKRQEPPSGFRQAVPGTLVMFTLLILLTSGSVDLLIERQRGLLRRLASAPMHPRDLVFGKWLGKMGLAICQVVIAMIIGALLFDIRWQPDLPMILLVMLAWAGVCTSLALLLGSLGRTEGQVSGIGVLAAMVLAAMGGCWWPIEVAPHWMQQVAGLLPTGWTITALHRLMSFEAGPASVLPQLALLATLTVALGWAAVRYFRYE